MTRIAQITVALLLLTGSALAQSATTLGTASTLAYGCPSIASLPSMARPGLMAQQFVVAIGDMALRNAAGGNCNVALGDYTGETLRNGSNNILIGTGADVPAPDTSDFINIDNVLCFERPTHTQVNYTQVDCPKKAAAQ